MKVELALDKPEYALGEAISASITLTNEGSEPIDAPRPELAISSVSFHLQRGTAAQIADAYIVRLGSDTENVVIEPGQRIEGQVELVALEAGEFRLSALYHPTGNLDPRFTDTNADRSNEATLSVRQPTSGATIKARIETEAGAFTMEFNPEQAHNHVLSFVQLANRGFFNGLSFHRVVPGFMIQGGCPQGTGTGGPGYLLPAEFNEIEHHAGVLSMARTSDPDSAGSQFFVCTARAASLDREYTVFGNVVAGLDVALKIGETEGNAGKFHMKSVKVFVG